MPYFILTYNIQIPSSVVDTTGAFRGCDLYNYSPTLPSGLVSAGSMFAGCSNFDQYISLPSGVQGISGMFSYCVNFNQNIAIPSSVQVAAELFKECPNLKQNIDMSASSLKNASNAFYNCVNYSAPIYLSSNCNAVENIAAHTRVKSVTLTAPHYNFRDLVGIFNTIDDNYHLDLGNLTPSYYNMDTQEWTFGDTLHHLTMPKNATIYNSIYRQNYSATVIGSAGWIEPIFGVQYSSYNGYIYQPNSWNEYNASTSWKNAKRASVIRAASYNSETGNVVAMYYDWANATYNSLTDQMDAPKYACVITLV